MEILVLVIHVGAALGIIGLVLLQHGKGADAGAAFGSGSAGGVFGSAGAANFLSRTTAVFAVVFFLTSMGLTMLSSRKADVSGVMGAPAAPAKAGTSDVPVPATPLGQSAPTPPAAGPAPAAPGGDAARAGEVPK